MAQNTKKKQENIPPAEGMPEAAGAHDDMHPVARWAQKNAKLLIAAASVIILIAAGYAIFDYYRGQQLEKAKVDLARIMAERQGRELAQGLADFAAESPDSLWMSVMLELTKAYQDQGDFEAAAQAWDKIAKTAGKDFSVPARLGRANSLAMAGKIDQAMAELEELDASAPETYAQLIKLKIAQMAEQAGDYERALAAYRAIREAAQANQQAFVDYKIRQFEQKLGADKSS